MAKNALITLISVKPFFLINKYSRAIWFNIGEYRNSNTFPDWSDETRRMRVNTLNNKRTYKRIGQRKMKGLGHKHSQCTYWLDRYLQIVLRPFGLLGGQIFRIIMLIFTPCADSCALWPVSQEISPFSMWIVFNGTFPAPYASLPEVTKLFYLKWQSPYVDKQIFILLCFTEKFHCRRTFP